MGGRDAFRTATLYAMDNRSSAATSAHKGSLETVEVTTGADVSASVIWLHGLGADGHDFEPVVPHLGLPPTLAVRFVFPHALIRPVTLNNGHPMRAWYDIRAISVSRDQDEAGIADSAERVRRLILREQERGIDPARIVLAGFSQGGAIALHVGLRHPQQLAGIMGLSTYLLFPDLLAGERHSANAQTPVFLGHGSMDPMVPISMGEETVRRLKPLDYPLTWKTYPIPHSVSPGEIADIGAWLRSCLG
jgi:phospholipase/carboxylesterase